MAYPLPNHLTDAQGKTHSIDAVVERVQALASAIHELGHSASDNAQAVGTCGEQTLARFDTNFGAINADVQRVFVTAEERVGQVPMPALIGVGVCTAVLLVLVALWVLATLAERTMRGGRDEDEEEAEDGKRMRGRAEVEDGRDEEERG